MDTIIIMVIIGIILVGICVYAIQVKGTEEFTQENSNWIPEKTPIPLSSVTGKDDPETTQILEKSVDPGAHLECKKWCEEKSKGKEKSKNFLKVCIDTCIQQKWRNPGSKINEFKP